MPQFNRGWREISSNRKAIIYEKKSKPKTGRLRLPSEEVNGKNGIQIPRKYWD